MRRDVVLVAVTEVGAVVEALFRPDLPWRWPTLVLAMVLLPTLLWRRTRPLPVLAACFGGVAALAVVDLLSTTDRQTGLGTMAVLLVSLYTLCRWGSGREVVIGTAVAMATAAICVVANYTGVSDAIGGFIVLAITITLALAIRFRGRARQREIEQVRLVEREQLARDLHDTVAHHVSAIAIRAQAGIAVAATRSEAALEALELIGTEASRTLAEMRVMVGVLRRDQRAELAPTPSLGDIARLAQHSAGAPRVEVSIADSAGHTAPAVATAVFRIAQEAVTNAQRHARHATSISVTVTGDHGSNGDGDRVRVRVADDGEPVDPRRTADGYGIRGMIERAELLGGTCSAGPGTTRGWVVVADLPCTGVPS